MVLEFLFFDKRQRDKVELFNKELLSTENEDVQTLPFQITYKDFDGCECWIVKYEKREIARRMQNRVRK